MTELAVTPLTLDGSTGEGGGQILRTGLALSMVTGRPLHITRIRAGRPKPGLMRQHLACVQAAVAVCGGQAEGAELNSQTLVFTPGVVRAGDYRFQIATAGSCLLVLQTVLPALMLADAPSQVELMGGTHNPMAPPFDFLERAFAPLVRRLGVGAGAGAQAPWLLSCGRWRAGGAHHAHGIHPAAAGARGRADTRPAAKRLGRGTGARHLARVWRCASCRPWASAWAGHRSQANCASRPHGRTRGPATH